MGLGRDAGAEACVYGERGFGQVRLDGQGVADDADVGAKAAQLNGVDGFSGVLLDEPLGEVE